MLVLRPADGSVVSGYNSHQSAGYSSLPVTVCEQARMSADGQSPRVKPVEPNPEQRAPRAKHVRPGRNDDEVVQTPVDYLWDLPRAVLRGDLTLTSGMSLFVRLPYLCRDAAAAADIVAVFLCPGSDVARAGVAGCLG
jgi:hypothetical protein